MFAANPDDRATEGTVLMFMVVGVERDEQPCALVTSTVTSSPSFNVVIEVVFEVLEALTLTPFTKNSKKSPPVAVKTILSPEHTADSPPLKLTVNSGLMLIVIGELSTVQVDPLTVEDVIRLKSVVSVKIGGL